MLIIFSCKVYLLQFFYEIDASSLEWQNFPHEPLKDKRILSTSIGLFVAFVADCLRFH